MQQVSPPSDALIREWLENVIAKSGLKPTPFARGAGLAPSTILRNLEGEGSLDLRTINKIIKHYDVQGPPIYGEAPSKAPDFSEAELASYTSEVPTWWKVELAPKQGIWQVNTRSLELAGVLPSDVIIVDSGTTPKAGDIVVARVLTGASAETVLRLYDPPYLLTDTADPRSKRKPELVDNVRVSILGVQIKLFRERKD